MTRKHIISLCFSILLGLFVLYPFIDFQPMLSQGDHGRDLYAFQATLNGDLPYKDYWWVYGPLMPFYYAGVIAFLGTTIQSILLGKLILLLANGILLFICLSFYASPIFCLIASSWFFLFSRDFFFTYNHIGGVTCLFGVILCLILYIKHQNLKHLYYALLVCLLLCLIKINFGICAVISVCFAAILIDNQYKQKLPISKKVFFSVALLGLPGIVLLINYILLNQLPLYAIRQCLPYLNADHPHTANMFSSLGRLNNYIVKINSQSWQDVLFFAIGLFSSLHLILLNIKKKIAYPLRKKILLTLTILIFIGVLNLHEFLASGVFYRSFWSRPAWLLFIFIIISFSLKNLPRIIRFIFYSALILTIFLQWVDQHYYLKQVKNPSQYLFLDRAKIYVGNDPTWIQTVFYSSSFLKQHLKEDETFLALPYDPLYYFLTNKQSPTRQLIFFDHINIPKQQEEKIINHLQTNKTNYILISSRYYSEETGLGHFGETYCPLLGNYVKENFVVIAEFGDWTNPPGWGWNHGTRILMHKSLLQKPSSVQ